MEVKELEKLIEAEEQRIANAPELNVDNYPTVHGWIKANDELYSKLNQLKSQLRLITENYTLSDIPEYGDLITFEDFKEMCESGGFIDYDGSGNYSTKTQMSNIDVYPSDIKSGRYRTDFTHVVWFNR